MSDINFFTAVSYGNQAKTRTQDILEKVDDYFYLGGRKAIVIPEMSGNKTEVILSQCLVPLWITAIKVATYLTVVIPVILLVAKYLLRSKYSFTLIDPKVKLTEGVNVQNAIPKIQQLFPKILKRASDPEIEWFSSGGGHLVFKLKEIPNYIFKAQHPQVGTTVQNKTLFGNEVVKARFDNMVKAKEICLVHQLGLLKIPQASCFDVNVDDKKYTLIAEEHLAINPHESAQEHLYHTHSKDLNETVRQLVTFIAKTGFSDVTWRNMPVIDSSPNFLGQRRIGLIDIEEMNSASEGLFGGYYRRGLLSCVSEEQIDTVISEAAKHLPLKEKEVQEAKNRRLKEIKAYKELIAFYQKKGIVGKEPLNVDINTLGLDLKEQIDMTWSPYDPITMKEVIECLLSEINKAIQKGDDQDYIKGKRYILLNTNHEPLNKLHHLGLPDKTNITDEDEKQIWFHRIIQALIDKGHLFKLEKKNGHGYFIQA